MDKLNTEIQILTRNYSVLRRRNNKWKFRGSISDSFTVQINQDLYSQQDLGFRKSIKRSSKLFVEIYKLWSNLNPFAIAGISRLVYVTFLRFSYKSLFKMHLSDYIFEEYVGNDVDLDFKTENCLFFSEFYDAVFDILDQATGGKSLSEYVSVLNNLATAIKYSEVLSMMNLHSKAHCLNKKPKYQFWMKEFMQVLSIQVKPEDQEGPRSLPRIQSTKNYLDKTSPLGSKKRSGLMKSFLLEEIIEGRNKFLSALHEEKRRIKAKDILQKISRT